MPWTGGSGTVPWTGGSGTVPWTGGSGTVPWTGGSGTVPWTGGSGTIPCGGSAVATGGVVGCVGVSPDDAASSACPPEEGEVETLGTVPPPLGFTTWGPDSPSRLAVGGNGRYLFYDDAEGLKRLTICTHHVDAFVGPPGDGTTGAVHAIGTYGDVVIWMDNARVRRATLGLCPLADLYALSTLWGSNTVVDPFGYGVIITEGRPAPYTERKHLFVDWDGNVQGNLANAAGGRAPNMFTRDFVYWGLTRYDRHFMEATQIDLGEEPISQIIAQDANFYVIVGSELRSVPVAGGAMTTLGTLPSDVQLQFADDSHVYVKDSSGFLAVAIAEPHDVVMVFSTALGESFSGFVQDATSLYLGRFLGDQSIEIQRAAKPR